MQCQIRLKVFWSGLFWYSLSIAIACRLIRKAVEMLEMFAYRTVAVMHFTDQNWIPKIVFCIRCVKVCKIGFTNWNSKIALLRKSMVVTYYINLFRTGAARHNGILMSLLLLVAETITVLCTAYLTSNTILFTRSCVNFFEKKIYF